MNVEVAKIHKFKLMKQAMNVLDLYTYHPYYLLLVEMVSMVVMIQQKLTVVNKSSHIVDYSKIY